HGLMLKPEVKTLKQIHKRFAWKDKAGLKASCYRPVHTKKIDELVGWLAYMSKPQFFLREQRPDAQGKLVPKKGKMTIERELEFVKALSKLKAKQRVFFIGMDPL
ncbi:MAG: hypothetical protein IKD58_00215, partial [Loktanella sp.]|nr:hypothetical protein [Loktanella sp.]